MHVTILGSGTCVPSLKRSAAALLIETGPHKMLIDAGPGTMRRLLEAGLSIFQVTHLLLTHFHPDHTAELVPLLFSTKYPDADQRRQSLTVLGAQGLNRFYGQLQVPYGDWIVLPEDKLVVTEFNAANDHRITLEACNISAYPVAHRPESRAYRFESNDGRVVTYSGDSDFCNELVKAAHKADLFICECAYPDELKAPGHLSPALAGRIAREAGAKCLVLTHLYPPCDQVDIVKQAQKVYQNGPVLMAQDLMRFDLSAMDI
jgi:ribonuclease BN (tRNA processing enzyme)